MISELVRTTAVFVRSNQSIRQVWRGCQLAIEGSLLSLGSQHIRGLFRTLAGTALFSLLAYIASRIAVYLLSLLWVVLWLLLPIDSSLGRGLSAISSSSQSVLTSILDAIPNIALYTVRYFYPLPLDRLFLHVTAVFCRAGKPIDNYIPWMASEFEVQILD